MAWLYDLKGVQNYFCFFRTTDSDNATGHGVPSTRDSFSTSEESTFNVLLRNAINNYLNYSETIQYPWIIYNRTQPIVPGHSQEFDQNLLSGTSKLTI